MFFKLESFRIFDLTSNSGILGFSKFGIINFVLNQSIALMPLAFSSLHRLIIVVMTSFLA